jgi:hypothetical protein
VVLSFFTKSGSTKIVVVFLTDLELKASRIEKKKRRKLAKKKRVFFKISAKGDRAQMKFERDMSFSEIHKFLFCWK